MTRLNYPPDGIYSCCQGSLDACGNELFNAESHCSFDIPSDFEYRGFCEGLGGTISGYHQDLNSISAKLRSIDDNFKNLSNDLENEARNIEPFKVKKRERMIK